MRSPQERLFDVFAKQQGLTLSSTDAEGQPTSRTLAWDDLDPEHKAGWDAVAEKAHQLAKAGAL